MDRMVKEMFFDAIKYVPYNFLKSFFVMDSSIETIGFRAKGYICGVCHPNENFEQIKAANIGWVRIDIPFPFEKEDRLTETYQAFKNRAISYKKNQFKVMAITPNPNEYFLYGIDVRTQKGEEKVREIARFLIQDLQGIVDGLQIANEMGNQIFMLPLNLKEAARFIG